VESQGDLSSKLILAQPFDHRSTVSDGHTIHLLTLRHHGNGRQFFNP
jgi:hypothetical protein